MGTKYFSPSILFATTFNKRLCAIIISFVISILLAISIATISVTSLRPLAADILPNEPFTIDGTTRHYRLLIPHTLSHPAPIVFAFHGTGDSPEAMADYSHLDQLASRHGFILVYPAARNGMWKTIDAGPDTLAANPDVLFFDRLLEHLSDQHEINRDRVYLVGMSNGGTFAQLLANARSNKIAAVVTHSGTKPANLNLAVKRFPIMLLVGANDSISPAMQADADQYRTDGHVVKFVSVPKLAHEWSPRHNLDVWNFLSQNQQEKNKCDHNFSSVAAEQKFWNEYPGDSISFPFDPFYWVHQDALWKRVNRKLVELNQTSDVFIVVFWVNIDNGILDVISLYKAKGKWHRMKWDLLNDTVKESVVDVPRMTPDTLKQLTDKSTFVDGTEMLFDASNFYIFLRDKERCCRYAIYDGNFIAKKEGPLDPFLSALDSLLTSLFTTPPATEGVQIFE